MSGDGNAKLELGELESGGEIGGEIEVSGELKVSCEFVEFGGELEVKVGSETTT